LEHNVVDFTFAEEKISPILIHLMDVTNVDDYRIEAVTTVSKIVRFLGKTVTEKVFLQHFSRLCSDVSFQVRRACASNFGEISSVVGQELTERVLLPHFKSLCEDAIWGVRKACADVFVPVSCVCSKEVRRNILAPLFVSFLCDQYKWVKIAAYQSLGPFISTFADPNKTGLYYTDGGVIIVDDSKDHESNSSTDSGCDSNNSSEVEMMMDVTAASSCNLLVLPGVDSLSLQEETTSTTNHLSAPSQILNVVHSTKTIMNISSHELQQKQVSPFAMTASPIGGHIVGGNILPFSSVCGTSFPPLLLTPSSSLSVSSCDVSPESSSYNAFQYWRLPIADLEVDPEIECNFLTRESDGGGGQVVQLKFGENEQHGVSGGEQIDMDLKQEEAEKSLRKPEKRNKQQQERQKQESEGVFSEIDGAKDGSNQTSLGCEKDEKKVPVSGRGETSESFPPSLSQAVVKGGDEREREEGAVEPMEGERPIQMTRTDEDGNDNQVPGDEEMRNEEIEQHQKRGQGGNVQVAGCSHITLSSTPTENSLEHNHNHSQYEPDHGVQMDEDNETAGGTSSSRETVDQKIMNNAAVCIQEPSSSDAHLTTSDLGSGGNYGVVLSSHSHHESFAFYTAGEGNSFSSFKTCDVQAFASSIHDSLGHHSHVSPSRILVSKQETIPPELLEHFLNMTNPVSSETVDHELTHHCAFSFPAVALTLGRKYWPCLKETYESLASDVQWKVRWTLASSIHQMALILGPEHTSRDLLPVFLNFMKDLDEVRFGLLQNLSSTLRLLNRPEQLAILPRMMEFLKMDNPRNWRFRSTLAEQVISLAPLFSPMDIKEYLLPIAFSLLKDKVSEVRLGAIRLLSTLMRHFFCDTSLPLRTDNVAHSHPQGHHHPAMMASHYHHHYLHHHHHNPTTAVSTTPCISSSSQSWTAVVGVNVVTNPSVTFSTTITTPSSPTPCTSSMMITDEGSRTIQGSVTTISVSGPREPQDEEGRDVANTASLCSNTCDEDNKGTTNLSRLLPLDQVSLELISELTALVQSNKWVFRQSFVFLCEQMIADQSLPVQVFNDHFFSCLLSLQNDRVSNVRLALSRCLSRSVYGKVAFHEKQQLITQVLEKFKEDPDLDVRRFAGGINGSSSSTTMHPPTEDGEASLHPIDDTMVAEEMKTDDDNNSDGMNVMHFDEHPSGNNNRQDEMQEEGIDRGFFSKVSES